MKHEMKVKIVCDALLMQYNVEIYNVLRPIGVTLRINFKNNAYIDISYPDKFIEKATASELFDSIGALIEDQWKNMIFKANVYNTYT